MSHSRCATCAITATSNMNAMVEDSACGIAQSHVLVQQRGDGHAAQKQHRETHGVDLQQHLPGETEGKRAEHKQQMESAAAKYAVAMSDA